MIAIIVLSFVASLADESPFASLLAERTAKRASMVVAYREAKEDDRDRIYREWQVVDKALAAKLFEITLKYADRPEAFEFLVTMVTQSHAEEKAAATAIMTHHLTKPHVGSSSNLRRLASVPAGVTLIEEIEAKNPSTAVQSAAAFALGEAAKLRVDAKSTDRATETNKAKAAFERALAKATRNDESMKDIIRQARGQLAGLANRDRLVVGAEAPDMIGFDTNNKPLKLSDYRGKVVLVDFWSFWCDSCVQLIPHQRELVKQFEGKPFVVLGVNGDLEYGDEFQRNIQKFKVTWRSFKNDSAGDTAKLSDAWNVEGWPTMYLIDAKGIIRKKWLGGPKEAVELDREIAKILSESGK